MNIVLASGKGGTGKTTVAVNMAYVLNQELDDSVALLDCDVEAPNDNLFLNRAIREEVEVYEPKPVLDADKCVGCGKCAAACNYNALAVVKKKVLLFPELCHSCGVCSYVCPQQALVDQPQSIGKICFGEDDNSFKFSYGLLNIGESLAPKVVKAVKQNISSDDITIIDAAPGTSCPVVAALEGADIAVLVTEPTPFGLNDLKLAAGLSSKMGIPTGIIINRSNGEDKIIADYSAKTGLPILGRIPFERKYAETYSGGGMIAKEHPEFNKNIIKIYDEIKRHSDSKETVELEDDYVLEVGSAQPLEKGTATAYKEITVISGKGGTGKTTLSSSISSLAQNVVVTDCDVDAANMYLLLNPVPYKEFEFAGGTKASIEPDKCIGCGLCEEHCHFDAIYPSERIFTISPLKCEGCGMCLHVCPVNAISETLDYNGKWYNSTTSQADMVHARLGIAEDNSGKLVTQVRNDAAKIASANGRSGILTDGPPGTACPVIASLSGTDLAVVVTEPTVSGVHDLKRALMLTNHFNVKALIVINKSDLNADMCRNIYELSSAVGSEVIGEIPFDRAVNDSLMAGKNVIDFGESAAADAIIKIWSKLKKYYGA